MKHLLVVALLAVSIPSPGMAAEPLDVLFSRPHMEAVASGDTLRYRHSRTSLQQGRVGPDLDTAIRLDVTGTGDDRKVDVTLDADGAARRLEAFRDVPGNPILMVFFESVVVSVSRATGGSPFYIRNRMKESFEKGLVTEQDDKTTVTLRPFAHDRNRAKMGPFADLEIKLALGGASPGQFEVLSAHTSSQVGTPPHYVEEFTLVVPQ